MTEVTPKALGALLDEAPLGGRFWAAFATAAAIGAVDYFDFYIVGFLVAVLVAKWQLTFGESALMLMSAGIGSIVGAFVWGMLADRLGRKVALVAGVLLCGTSSGLVAFVPDGDWMLFSVLRFFSGMGLAGATAPAVALMVEFTPLRVRTILSGLGVVVATLGVLIAAATAGWLMATLGWRGIAALGFAPIPLGLLAIVTMPESPRWLLATGRMARARRIGALMLGKPVPEIRADRPEGPPPVCAGLLHDRRKSALLFSIWLPAGIANYGVYLWGPTIVAALLGIGAAGAARMFILVALSGIVGKVLFSILPYWLGRRRTGQLGGLGILLTLGLAAVGGTGTILGVPAFLIFLVAGALFFDGVYANMTPYSAELYPVHLSGRAVGLAQALNGAGRILGPLALALIAGTSNVITPAGTVASIGPAFLFLAGCGAVMLLGFMAFGVETHGRSLDLGHEEGAGR